MVIFFIILIFISQTITDKTKLGLGSFLASSGIEPETAPGSLVARPPWWKLLLENPFLDVLGSSVLMFLPLT